MTAAAGKQIGRHLAGLGCGPVCPDYPEVKVMIHDELGDAVENQVLLPLRLPQRFLGQYAIGDVIGQDAADARQAQEEAHAGNFFARHRLQVEGARLDGLGHAEQDLALPCGPLVPVKDVHVTKAQAVAQDAAQQVFPVEGVLAGNHMEGDHILHIDMRSLVRLPHRPYRLDRRCVVKRLRTGTRTTRHRRRRHRVIGEHVLLLGFMKRRRDRREQYRRLLG